MRPTEGALPVGFVSLLYLTLPHPYSPFCSVATPVVHVRPVSAALCYADPHEDSSHCIRFLVPCIAQFVHDSLIERSVFVVVATLGIYL